MVDHSQPGKAYHTHTHTHIYTTRNAKERRFATSSLEEKGASRNRAMHGWLLCIPYYIILQQRRQTRGGVEKENGQKKKLGKEQNTLTPMISFPAPTRTCRKVVSVHSTILPFPNQSHNSVPAYLLKWAAPRASIATQNAD